MSDDDLRRAYLAALEEAHGAPKAGFGAYTQNAVFAPANKAIALWEEIRRRGLSVPKITATAEPDMDSPIPMGY